MSNKITQPFQVFHDAAGDGMALIAPALAPALSAIAVYAGLVGDFGRVAAFIGAFVVEGLGFAAVRLMLRVWNDTEPSAMMRAATLAMSVTYLVATYAILMSTHVAGYAMSFPLLTITGAFAYGINQELGRQETAVIDEAKARIDLQVYRKQRMAEVSAEVSTRGQKPSMPAPSTSGGRASVDDLRRYLVDNPDASVRTAAAALGMSKSWVADKRKEMGL